MIRTLTCLFLCSAVVLVPGCGGDASDGLDGLSTPGVGGNGGASGAGGSSGQAGAAGKAGSAGSSGAAGKSGASGSAGKSGSAGASGAAGSGGSAGSSGQGGQAGAAGSAGTSGSSGSGGSAGSGGSSGMGGAGGSAPMGPCDGVIPGHAAVSFTAPSPHAAGFVGFAAWINYPDFSGLVDTNWSDPYPGCVSLDAQSDTFRCDFGAAPESTKIYFVTGMHADQSSKTTGDLYFSKSVGGVVTRVGSYVACLGTTEVGTFKNDTFTGALSSSDEQAEPQNMEFIVPAP